MKNEMMNRIFLVAGISGALLGGAAARDGYVRCGEIDEDAAARIPVQLATVDAEETDQWIADERKKELIGLERTWGEEGWYFVSMVEGLAGGVVFAVGLGAAAGGVDGIREDRRNARDREQFLKSLPNSNRST